MLSTNFQSLVLPCIIPRCLHQIGTMLSGIHTNRRENSSTYRKRKLSQLNECSNWFQKWYGARCTSFSCSFFFYSWNLRRKKIDREREREGEKERDERRFHFIGFETHQNLKGEWHFDDRTNKKSTMRMKNGNDNIFRSSFYFSVFGFLLRSFFSFLFFFHSMHSKSSQVKLINNLNYYLHDAKKKIKCVNEPFSSIPSFYLCFTKEKKFRFVCSVREKMAFGGRGKKTKQIVLMPANM